MASIEFIYDLLNYYKSGNDSGIDSLILELIKDQESKGNYFVAKKIRSIYAKPKENKEKKHTITPSGVNPNESKLFLLRNSKIGIKDVILSNENQIIYNEIVENFRSRDLFQEHNLDCGNKVLLYGPPGTGKTMLAYAIAGDLNIPIIHVNLDNLISSFLGETGKNIKQIFDEAGKGESILFLDEFDAVGKQRDDNNELGELKRVVTVLLQNIDMMNPKTILLAATNHNHLLDIAILRRFDYKMRLENLDFEGVKHLLSLFLNNYKVNIDKVSKIASGMSGALIKQLVDKSLRKFLLGKSDNIEGILINEFGLHRLKERKFNIKDNYEREILTNTIKELRRIDPKKFTYSKLEEITSLPHSTLNSLIK